MNRILLTYSLICIVVAGISDELEQERRRMFKDIASGDTLAWSRHITGQDVNHPNTHHYFKSVACVSGAGTTPAGDTWTEDQLYVVTERIIDSNTVKYVELFTPRDWGNDPNYCWFVDCGGKGMGYQPGQAEIPEIPEVPEVPPEQWRDEALVCSDNANLRWFDPDYVQLDSTSLGKSGATTLDVETNGTVIVGLTGGKGDPFILRVDLDKNVDGTFYQPEDNWGPSTNTTCLALRLTSDQAALYAVTRGTFAEQRKLYKFNNVTGAELWSLSDYSDFGSSYGMAVDSSDNVYVPNSSDRTLVAYQASDGAVLKTYAIGRLVRDVWIDEAMNRVFAAGVSITKPYYQLGASDFTTPGNYATFSIGNNSAWQTWSVKTDGTNVYACGTRTASGIGGANATVWKLDSDLNLLASYDGNQDDGCYLWFDENDNLVVKHLTTGYDCTFHILDPSDLSLIATKSTTDLSDLYGNEATALDYMTSGTPGVPGVPGSPEIPEAWVEGPGTQLDGASVCVYADAVPRGTFVMDGNDIADFNEADYTVVIAGLNYYSIYESFPLTKDKTRIINLAIDFYETLQAHVGTTRTYSNNWQFSADGFATQLDPVTEIKFGSFPRGWGNDPTVYVWIWNPVPCTIRGMYPQMEIAR